MDLSARDALQTILEQPSKGRLIEYAQTYARVALSRKMEEGELRVQLMYVLANLTGWRGETARETKKTLKQAVETLGTRLGYSKRRREV